MEAIRNLLPAPARENEHPDVVEARVAAEIAELNLRRARAEGELQVELAAVARRRQEAFNDCLQMIRRKFYGRKFDQNWFAYVVAQVEDYATEHNIVSNAQITGICNDIIHDLQNNPPTHPYNIDNMLALRLHNDTINGKFNETCWYKPWTWHKLINLSENTNGSSQEHNLYSLSQMLAMGLVGVTGTILAIYGISKASSEVIKATTTLSLESQRLLVTVKDMLPSFSSSTNQAISNVYTKASSSSLSIPEDTPVTSMLRELIFLLKRNCTKTLSGGLTKVSGWIAG